MENIQLFRGLKFSYINLSFYERNINQLIIFPSFTSTSKRKEIAEIFSGRRYKEDYSQYYLSEEDRKKKELFSILLIINYNIEEGWEPSTFGISSLSKNSNEEEFLFQPFSFFKIEKVEINFEHFEADIYLKNIGKKEIFENEIKENNNFIITYDEKNNIMNKVEGKYEDINLIIKEKYPYFDIFIEQDISEITKEENSIDKSKK